MEITALFDDVDSAEFALVNLQALGIFPQSYKIHSLHAMGGTENAWALPAAQNLANPSVITPGLTPPTVGVPGVVDTDSAFYGEPQNREVMLLLKVEDGAEHKAQSALISNHARRVKIV